jgi:hypothetical protein
VASSKEVAVMADEAERLQPEDVLGGRDPGPEDELGPEPTPGRDELGGPDAAGPEDELGGPDPER